MKGHFDFETRSEADLKKTGAYRYSRDPSTQPWCLAYKIDGHPRIWRPDHHGWDCPEILHHYIRDGGIMVAHNAPFEYVIWNNVMVPRYGWPKITWDQLDCTMSRCYAMALPGSLEMAASALGLDVGKDKTGHALMMRMAKPWKYDGDRALWLTDREGTFTFMGDKVDAAWCLDRLCDYCETDVDVEEEIDNRVLALSPFERRVWLTDMAINERGLHFDMPAVQGALRIRDHCVQAYDERISSITDGAVQKTTALPALKDWLAEYHLMFPESLDKQHCEDYMNDDSVPQGAKAAIEARVLANRATSVRKLDTIVDAEIGGRVKGCFQYSGAGTRRWAGRMLQPHNLNRSLSPPDKVETLMEVLTGDD